MGRLNLYKRIILYFIGTVFIVSILAIMGWFFKIELFTQLIPGLPTMKFNTAFSFFLLTIVIYFTYKKTNITLIYLFNSVLLVITGLTFLQDIGSFNIGIDQLIVVDEKGVLSGNPTPGRMSTATSLSFILLSISIFLILSKKRKGKILSAYLLYGVNFFSFIAITSYFFKIATSQKIEFISSMAIHTAICFL